MKKKSTVSMFLILLLAPSTALFGVLLQSRTFALMGGSNPTLWVLPPVNVYEKNSPPFRVTIYLNDTKNPIGPLSVSAWQLTLAYDPSILSIYNITEGPYLKTSGAPTVFSSNPSVGGEIMACLVTSTSAAASGPGDLVYVWFNVVGNGKVNFVLSGVQLLDLNGNSLTMGPSQNGVFYTTYPKAHFYYLPSTTAPSLLWIPRYLFRDPILGENIVFNASALMLGITYWGSYDPNGNITNYRWDFGDGNVTSGNYQVLTHSYNSTGTYHVVLNVTDNEGKTDSYYLPVMVVEHDVAVTGIQVSPTKASPAEDVSIKVTIKNQGTYPEYVNVTLFYNANLIWYNTTSTPGIGKKSAWSNVFEYDPVTYVQPMEFLPGQSITINYVWATAGVPSGNFTIWANASLVTQSAHYFLKDVYQKELDSNMTNNNMTYGTVTISAMHNIAVENISVSPALKAPNIILYGTSKVTVDTVITNTGDFDETFNTTLYLDSTQLITWTNLFLKSKASTTLEYVWDLSGVTIGEYTLKTEASVVNGEIRTDDNTLQLTVIVTIPPVASFLYTPTSPVAGQIVNFDATASKASPNSTITSYIWRVNGTVDVGMIVGQATPAKFFDASGTYNISLTVIDSIGLTASTFQLVSVAPAPPPPPPPPPPTATRVFVYPNESSAAPNQTFTIEIIISNVTRLNGFDFYLTWNTSLLGFVKTAEGPFLNSSGDYQTFYVSKGPGTIGWTHPDTVYVADTLLAPTYSTSPSGTGVLATVTFKVLAKGSGTLNLHNSTLIRYSTYVPPPTIPHTEQSGYFDNQALIASFDYSPTKPLVGKTVTFDASGSYNPNGQIVSYAWDFGDGTTTTETNPITTHIFSDANTYTVKLTIIDDSGRTQSAAKTLRVYVPPYASFTWSPQNPYANQTVFFYGYAYDPDGWIVSILWDFGDGTYANGSPYNSTYAYHVYNQKGTYTVTLTATDNDGLNTTFQAQITVVPRLLISIAPDKGPAGTKVTVNGTNATPNGNVSVYWGSYNPYYYPGRFNYTLMGNTTVDSNGRFTFSFDIPPSSLEPHSIKAVDLTTQGYDEKTFELLPGIIINPTSGPIGTKIAVTGTGFPSSYQGPGMFYLMFDDQLLGFALSDQNGNLQAIINVPFASPGQHAVKVLISYYSYYGSKLYEPEASFTIIDSSPLDVTADVGAIYFQGETVESYVQTVFEGTAVNATTISCSLIKPDGTTETVSAQIIRTGFYKIQYPISTNGAALGTYTLTVDASYNTETIGANGTTIKTFLVQPTWKRDAPKMAAFSIASLGLIGAMIMVWRKEKKRYL